jgi:EAL domain-containing protein (putative c-di-GMP-specific phosphodiesterase class I)/ActR/RegA family two-component response regulator
LAVVPRQPTILALDDDEQMLEVESRMLRSLGYTSVRTAASAREAFLHLDYEYADILVCDLAMPDVDGIEFLRTLSESSFRGSVILLSGAGARVLNSVRKLVDNGPLTMLGVLTKPASRPALQALLDRWEPPVEVPTLGPYMVFSAEELHRANRERQWCLHYQPQVNLATGELVGFEALIRWRHPRFGLIYPDRFIATAEECGAIDPLTEWVVREALRQQLLWQAGGLDVQLAINVTMESLGSLDFERRFVSLVRDTGADPDNVTLEITESRLMASAAAPLENLARLRMQRFPLSIDDFGTGHSSLTRLRDLPFTELKVDRSFVHGAHQDPILRPILESTLGMARELELRTVAEGVELEADWHLLRALGCERAQGYFIGRPMAAEQIDAWWQTWQSRRPQLARS